MTSRVTRARSETSQHERPGDVDALLREALAELLVVGTAEELLEPRRRALERFMATGR